MSKTLDVMPIGVTEAREPNNSEVVSQGPTSENLFVDIVRWLNTESSPAPKSGVQSGDELLESPALDRILIGSLLDLRLRMAESLVLTMEQDDEFHVAWCEELDEYGYGLDPITAVQDARHTIAELYWQLKADQDRLGPDLAETWRKLSALVYEI